VTAFRESLDGPGCFVAGTDTGVGKTLVARRIAAAAREAGRSVAVMKPFATGGGEDTAALIEAAGGGLDPLLVTPARFETPCAPPIAAACEGRSVDLDAVWTALEELRRDADFLVVEGIAGVLCPVTGEMLLADLIGRFGLPVALVVPVRLGMIGQALLSVEALRSRGIEPAGIVWNHIESDPHPTAAEDKDWILRRTGIEAGVEVPFSRARA